MTFGIYGRKRDEKFSNQFEQEKADYANALTEGARISQFNGQNGNGYQPLGRPPCPMPEVKPPKPESNPKDRLVSKLQTIISEFEDETSAEITDIAIDRVNVDSSCPYRKSVISGYRFVMR